MPPFGHHRVDWEAHRSTIEDLYVVQDKPLIEVIKIMRSDFNVDATTKMYKKRIKAWGMFKNINGDEMLAMIRIKERRRKQGKRTRFHLRGKPVLDSKLRRFATRHGVVLNDEDSSGDVQAILKGITFSTPEPDDLPESITLRHDDTLHLSSVLSNAGSLECFMGSPRTEPRQCSPHEYPGISWDMPMSSLADCPAQGATQFSPDHYLADTACNGPTTQQFYAWLDEGHLSRFDGYNHSTGQISPLYTNLGIEHEIISDSTAQSFLYEQHLGIHHTADRSPDSLELAAPPFTQAQALSWDCSQLYNAVITNNVALTRPPLSEGMNSNLTARDGTTPLHPTTFQRNIELVRSLMDHGSKTDALTNRGQSDHLFAARGNSHYGQHGALAAYTKDDSINHAGCPDDDFSWLS